MISARSATTTTMHAISYTGSRRRQNEILEDYSQVRSCTLFKVLLLDTLLNQQQQQQFVSHYISLSLSWHFVFFLVFPENSILLVGKDASLLLISRRKEKVQRAILMNCVRRVCEQNNKRKCICICKMGCGSTKASSDEEKNVSVSRWEKERSKTERIKQIPRWSSLSTLHRRWKTGDRNANKNVWKTSFPIQSSMRRRHYRRRSNPRPL